MNICFFQLFFWVFNKASFSKTYCSLLGSFFLPLIKVLILRVGWWVKLMFLCSSLPASDLMTGASVSRILNQAGPKDCSQCHQNFLCLRVFCFVCFITFDIVILLMLVLTDLATLSCQLLLPKLEGERTATDVTIATEIIC